MSVIAFPVSLGLVRCTALVQPFELGGYTARSLDLEAHGSSGEWQSTVHGRGAAVDIARQQFMQNLQRHIGLALKLQRGFPQGAITSDREEVARQFTYGTNVYRPADLAIDEFCEVRGIVGDQTKMFYEAEVQFFRTNLPYLRQGVVSGRG